MWSNPGNEVTPPYTSVFVAIKKRAFQSPATMVANFTFYFIYMYICIYMFVYVNKQIV